MIRQALPSSKRCVIPPYNKSLLALSMLGVGLVSTGEAQGQLYDGGLKTADFRLLSQLCVLGSTEGKMYVLCFAGLRGFVKFSAVTVNKP